MTRITYVEFSGEIIEADVLDGQTVMEGGINHGVEGIVAECVGSCSCATCHVYIDSCWLDRIGDPGALENDMLEAVEDRRPNSRLSCQINVTEELDGMIVRLPEFQI
jgi:2Fe-2S ferredoxin